MKSHVLGRIGSALVVAILAAAAWIYFAKNKEPHAKALLPKRSLKNDEPVAQHDEIVSAPPKPRALAPRKKYFAPEIDFDGIETSVLPTGGVTSTVSVADVMDRTIASEDSVEDSSDSEFRRSANISISPYFAITAIASTDYSTHGSSTVASQYSVGMVLGYTQEWTEDLETSLTVKVGKIAFEDPATSLRTLSSGAGKLLTGIGVNAKLWLTEKLNLEVGAEYGKDLFVRAANTQSDTVDALNIISLGTKISYDALNLDPFLLGFSGSCGIKLPISAAGYDVHTGYEYGASVYLKQSASEAKDSSRFKTELAFLQRVQNTSVASQKETSILFRLSYAFGVGKRQGRAR